MQTRVRFEGIRNNRSTQFDLKEVLETKNLKKGLKDIDFERINSRMKLMSLDLDEAATLSNLLKKDSAFLSSVDIMDFSLLLVIENLDKPGQTSRNAIISGNQVYHIGIIDFLQTWDFQKRAESWLKSGKEAPSAVPPEPYQKRFAKFTR
jgi:hypothetical protein